MAAPQDAVAPGNRPTRRLAPWRVVLATAWMAVILGVGVATRLDRDLQTCSTTTVVAEPARSVEVATDAAGAPAGETTTDAGGTEQTTTACSPLGLAEIAVLSLPALVLISPVLKGINIAGLFGFDFRDLQEKVVQEAKEQVVRVIVEREIAAQGVTSATQADQGEISEFPSA